MRTVLFETSTSRGEVGVAEDDRLLEQCALAVARKHARNLVPTLGDLLAGQEWSPKTIELVIVGIGPGSYTGLRVGVVTAKTLAYATGAALLGIDSMAVLAESAPADALRIATIADAQQGLVYATLFERVAPGAVSAPVRATEILDAHEWASQLPEQTYVTGPGLTRHAKLVGSNAILAPEEHWQPTVQALLSVGWREYQAGRRDDLWSLEPSYLRPSSAEQKWKRRQAEKDSAAEG